MGKLSGLPTPVGDWIVQTGLDSVDDEAVWVWALLEEDEVEFSKIRELKSIITKQVREVTGPGISSYVRFRGISEEV